MRPMRPPDSLSHLRWVPLVTRERRRNPLSLHWLHNTSRNGPERAGSRSFDARPDGAYSARQGNALSRTFRHAQVGTLLMLIALFGNVHGRLDALEAVLAEIDEAGIQTMVNTGDCVVGGSHPNEVVDLIRARHIPTVQGSMDRYAALFVRKRAMIRKKAAEHFDAIAWTHERLSGENLEFLRALPHSLTLTVEGIAIAVCHGTHGSPSDALRPDDSTDRFRRQRERTAGAPILVCGGAHGPFARWVDETVFVNPGAVGDSSESPPRGCYAQIDTDIEPWAVTFRSVAYGTA